MASAINWASNNNLSLRAHDDVIINAAITNTGSGNFSVNAAPGAAPGSTGLVNPSTGAIATSGRDVYINAPITVNAGRIDIIAVGDLNVGANPSHFT